MLKRMLKVLSNLLVVSILCTSSNIDLFAFTNPVSDNSIVKENELMNTVKDRTGVIAKEDEVCAEGFIDIRNNSLDAGLAERDAKYGKTFSMTSVDIGTWRFAQTYARTEIFPALNAARIDPENQWYEVTEGGITTHYTTNVTEPFIYDYDLEKIAMQRVFEMSFRGFHTRPDGTSYLNAWRGSINFDSNGQNELEGHGTDAINIVDGFMEEDGKSAQAHRIAILGAENRRDYIGIGCIYHDGYYAVCIEMSDGKEYLYDKPLSGERLSPTPAVDTYKDMTVTFARGYSGLGNADYGNSSFSLLGVPSTATLEVGDVFDPSDAYIGAAGMIALCKVKDRNDITWVSKDPNVVKIENGKFKAVGAGQTTVAGCIDAFKYSSDGTTVSIPVENQFDGFLVRYNVRVNAPIVKTEQPSFITDTYRNWDGKIDPSVLATNDYFDFNPVGNYIGALSVSIDQKPSGADAYVSVLNGAVRFKKGCPAGSYRIRYDVSGSDTVDARTEYMTVIIPSVDSGSQQGGTGGGNGTVSDTGNGNGGPSGGNTTVTPPSTSLKSQKITVKVSSKTYKAKTLKKKDRRFKIGAKGKTLLTFKVVKYPKKAKKYIRVSDAGTVTMRKGAKKGTYKIKISARKDRVYKSATRYVTVKVK